MLFPDAYADNVFAIDYPKLYEKGYRGLIFDVDNTLVPHGADSTPRVDALFARLHEIGFQTLLLSNNDEERICRFIRGMETFYVCDAEKPKPGGYRRALELLGLPCGRVVMIGDQIFTDVLGANRCGIATVLVKYFGYDTEKKIGIRRRAERLLLAFRRLVPASRNRLGEILMGEDEAANEKRKDPVL